MIRALHHQCQLLYGTSCKSFGIFLTRFNGTQGIVRCNHLENETTIELLRSIKMINDTSIKVETVGTSGTIKSLLKKHFPDSFNQRNHRNKKHTSSSSTR
jgi:RNase P/RNase MRP subunit POP5